MNYVGDFATGATVILPWNTNNAAGASATRSAAGTLRIYKDNSVTQRSSLSGVTDNSDFDSVVGLQLINIDLSDNTDAGFYAAGHDYFVVDSAGTIDSQTVNPQVGHFSIENRFASSAGVAGFVQNVAFANFQFRMSDAAGFGVTGLTDADFSQKLYSIGGGANGTLSGTITEDPGGEGFYLIDLSNTELNGRSIALTFEAAGTIQTQLTIITGT